MLLLMGVHYLCLRAWLRATVESGAVFSQIKNGLNSEQYPVNHKKCWILTWTYLTVFPSSTICIIGSETVTKIGGGLPPPPVPGVADSAISFWKRIV